MSYERNIFLSHGCFSKRNFYFRNVISLSYSTLHSIYKNFQITMTCVIGKFEWYSCIGCLVWYVKSFVRNFRICLGGLSKFIHLFDSLKVCFSFWFFFFFFLPFCFMLTCFEGKWRIVIKHWKIMAKMHETEQRASICET